MKKSSSFLLGRIVGLFVLIATLFMSCDVLGVGLGEDVDTTSPTADIEYPPSSAIIKGTFLLAGSCDDDKGLDRIDVSVKNLDTNTLAGKYQATLASDKKSWSILLNKESEKGLNGWEYLDGKYEVTIIAYDRAGRDSGERSRTFEIDNTAPFFVISKPGVIKKDNKDPSAYGSVYNIEGTIADDHAVESMSVDIFDSNGKKITTTPLVEESIATAGGSTVTFAKYVENGKEEINNRYSFIYNADTYATSKGTKSYYCSVSLSDNAKEYKDVKNADGVGPGNTTSNVYLYDKVYPTLMSSKNGGLGLSASALNRINNRTEDNVKALALLKDSVTDTASTEDNYLCFTLNPQANPTYVVSGLALKYAGEDTSLQKISPNQTLTVILNSGLDNTNVDPSTVKVWIHEVTEDDIKVAAKKSSVISNVNELAAKVKLLEEDSEFEFNDKRDAEKDGERTTINLSKDEAVEDNWILLHDNSTYNGATVSSTTLSVTIPEPKSADEKSIVEIGHFYVVAITGYDADKIEFQQSDVYGFEGNQQGEPPTITITNPSINTYYGCSDDIEFTGIAKFSDSKSTLFVTSIEATIAVTDENGNEVAEMEVNVSRSDKNQSFDGTNKEAISFDNKIWKLKPSKLEGYDSIKVEKYNPADPTTKKSFTYALTIKMTSSTNHSQTETRTTRIDATPPVIGINSPVSGSSVSKSKISFTVTDTGTGIAEDADVDAVISNTNEDILWSLVRGDNEVIDLSTYSLRKVNGAWTTDEIDFTTKGEGSYTLKVKAKDKLGNWSDEKVVPFYYDKTPPSINTTDKESAIVNATSGVFKLSGTVSDSNNIEKVEIREGSTVLRTYLNTKDKDADGHEKVNVIEKVLVGENEEEQVIDSFYISRVGGNVQLPYEYEFTSITDGTHNYTISTTDTADKTTEQAFKVSVDTKAPTISGKLADTLVCLDTNPYVSITAVVEDEKKDNSASGLAGVYYKISKTVPTAPTLAVLTKKANPEWTEMPYSISGYKANNVDISKISGIVDDTYYIYYVALDNNGNITYDSNQKTKLTLDKSIPEVKLLSYSYTGGTETTITSSVIKLPKTSEGKMTVKVKVDDSNQKSLTVKKEGASITPTPVVGETGVYLIENVQTASNDGSFTTLEFTGIDKNERVSATETLRFAYDEVPPTVTVNSIDAFIESTAVSVTGTTTDNNLKSVVISAYKTDDLVNPITDGIKNITPSEDGSWKTTFYGLGEYEYVVKVVAEDEFTNITEKTTNNFKVDTTDPISTLVVTPTVGKKFLNDNFIQLTGATPYSLTSGSSYNTNATFTLGGTITEANLATVKLAVKKNGTAVTGSPFTLTPDADKNWTYEQTVSGTTSDGKYEYELTITDEAKRNTVYKTNILVDTIAPTMVITSPAADVTSKDIALGGTLVENGSGVKSVKYSITRLGTTDTTIVSNASADVNGSKWSATNDLGSTEGQFKITAKITDNMGSSKSAAAKTFWFDSANPTLTLDDFAASDLKDVPVITGIAKDNNGITEITITSNDTTEGKTHSWTVDLESAEYNKSTGKFTKTLTGLAEVNHTFTVTVKDGAGKTSTASKSVRYDKTVPSISNDKITTTANYTTVEDTPKNWFKSPSVGLTLTASDTNSGVNTVTYVVKDSSGNETAKGTIFGNASGVYAASVNCGTQGLNTITVTVTDKAGNSAAPVIFMVYIDTEVPSSMTASTAKRGGTAIANWAPSKSILTNGSTTLTFAISGADATAATGDSSGLKSVVLKKIGSTVFTAGSTDSATTSKAVELTNGAGSITLAKTQIAAGSTGDVVVTVTDNVGNTADFAIANLTIDTTAPSIGFSSIGPVVSKAGTSYLNGTITVAGRINESNTLKSASYKVYSDGTEVTSLAHTFTKTELTGVDNNFSFTIDTTATGITDEKNLNIVISAEDEAGNKATYDSTTYNGSVYKVSQDTDRPEIKISNVSAKDTTIKDGNVIITVSDDDGAVTSFDYSEDAGSTWTAVENDSITFSEGGAKSLYFKVKDAAGKTFTTNTSEAAEATLTRPYVIYGKNAATDNNAAVTFKVDLKEPIISGLNLVATTSSTAPETGWSSTSGSVQYGATTKNMFIKFTVAEDVGMHSAAKDDISVKVGTANVTMTSGIVVKTTNAADNTKLDYVVGPIDTSKLSVEDTQTVTITVTDNSGRSASTTFNVYIDGKAPTVTITSPDSSETITGKVTVKGRIEDTSGIAEFKYFIPTTEVVDPDNLTAAEKTALTGYDWVSMATPIGDNGVSNAFVNKTSAIWELPFLSSSFADVKHDVTIKNSSNEDVTVDGISLINYATASGKDYVPIYFYVKDTTGNEGYILTEKIKVNTDGGIPTVEMTSHESNLMKSNTTVNFMGTASDDEGVASVKITKLEYTKATKITASLESGTTEEDAATKWVEIAPTTAMVVTDKGTVKDGKIICAGTKSWKASIDTSKISSDVTGIRVTVESYDENGTSSSKVHKDGTTVKTLVRSILVDRAVPELKSASIVGFASKPTSATQAATFEKVYSSGMYISKKNANYLYLKLYITDDSSVTGINFSCETGTGYVDAVSTTNKVDTGLNKDKYTVLLPITMTDEGRIYATLEMLDGQHTDVTTNFSFYIDNTAPTLYSDNGKALGAADATTSIRLMNDSNQTLGDTYLVENSNGSFVFGDSVTEAGAGLQYLAFWFKRTGETETRAYNPMYKKEGEKDNKIVLGTKPATPANGNIYINEDGLACMHVTGTKIVNSKDTNENDVSTITLSTATNVNDNVRVGGLIKYDGAYRKITATGTGTITFLPAVTATNSAVKAELIYAQVVDHQGIEVDDKYNDTANGDGDGMTEVLKIKGAEYTWQAALDTLNIPDGPIEIYVTAIDNAGNISKGTVSTKIANNRPRVTRVLLATDLNGNGTFDFYNEKSSILNNLNKDDTTVSGTQFGEFVFYSTLKPSVDTSNKVGDGQSLVTLSGRTLRIKKDLLVLPEFVGGNGVLKYGYELTNTAKEADGSDKPQTSPRSGTNALVNDVDGLKLADRTGTVQKVASLIQSDKVSAVDKFGGVVLTMNNTDATIAALDDGKIKNLAFTFWDETEETTQGTNSLWAMINIPAYVDVTDTTKPEGTITPFWWNSKEDSSFVYDSEGNPEGHIDLPEGTENPGVAGKVWINGTAYDETRIGAIHVIEPDTTTDLTVISWDDTAKKFVCADGAEIVSEIEPSQDGHTIKWRYKMDMTSYGVKTNQKVRTYVVDAQNNKNDTTAKAETTSTTTEALKALYVMDFVPYIKSIYPATATSANRSRLGKFPVQAGQPMIIEGMNFGSADKTKYTVKFKNSAGTVTETGTVTAAEVGKITVTAPQYSRYVEVTYGGVTTKNNTNTNGGYNIEAGYVAGAKNISGTVDHGFSKANAAGTNFWTDDRYVSVWSNTARSGSVNPWDGTVRKFKTSESKSGKFYANKSGAAVDEMTSSLDTWFGAWSSPNMMIYDEAGNGDFANKRTLYNNSQASFVNPVETMDMAIIGGIPWYVFNDNYVGGSSANSWGAGLILAREGYNFPKGDFNSTSSPTESEFVNIIERQGSGTAADSRDSSGGYDSVLHQFKNPRITGWYDDTSVSMNNGNSTVTYDGTNYIYVSYYDSFSHCLKYAAFSEAWSKDGVGSKWGNVNGTKNFIDLARSANSMAAPTTVVSGVDRMYTAYDFGTDAGEEAGEWSDIMVDPSDHYPVIVYYNKTKGTLEVAHGKNNAPETANYKTAAGSFTDTTDTGWTKKKSITPIVGHDFGRYVSAEMDKNGNIHATAQDFTTGALWYVFLEKSGATYNPKYQIIDAEISAGIWADIQLDNDVTTNTTWAQYKPVISYIDQSKKLPKIAYVETIGSGETVVSCFEAVADANNYEAKEMKTSCMTSVYEAKIKNDGAEVNNAKAKAAVAFNSDMLCIDFLRGE